MPSEAKNLNIWWIYQSLPPPTNIEKNIKKSTNPNTKSRKSKFILLLN